MSVDKDKIEKIESIALDVQILTNRIGHDAEETEIIYDYMMRIDEIVAECEKELKNYNEE